MIVARTEQDWLALIRALILRGEPSGAQAEIARALVDYPHSIELRRAQAGLSRQTERTTEAESQFRQLLALDPGDAASAFSLAQMLKEQGRTAAAAAQMCTWFAAGTSRNDANLAIHAIELLDDCDRKREAAAIAEATIKTIPDDARLHAYAGMLEIQLGAFDHAREHYLAALERSEDAWGWHVPIGLSSAQRYTNDEHPDFTLFRAGLQRDDLSESARAELHFALGKANDDIGKYGEAGRYFREGNAIGHRLTRWSRKTWRRTVEARLAATPVDQRLEPLSNFTPIFIIGMPRSGTTLLAGLLSRYSHVCNRGEQPWLARLAQQPNLNGTPDRIVLASAAATYATHVRQDDANSAHWFLDKQPLNFRYVDLALALFPNARIIHCRRDTRDNALSLWMQCFMEDVQGYSYDFEDIALVARDCERLMTHWRARYPASIRSIRYEDLVDSPNDAVANLAAWIGLPSAAVDPTTKVSNTSITTASVWQARQPIYTRSVGRWKHYVPHIPELSRLPMR